MLAHSTPERKPRPPRPYRPRYTRLGHDIRALLDDPCPRYTPARYRDTLRAASLCNELSYHAATLDARRELQGYTVRLERALSLMGADQERYLRDLAAARRSRRARPVPRKADQS